MRVIVKGEEVRQRIRAELTKKGQTKPEVVAITYDEKGKSFFLHVKPQEEGHHTLLVTISGHPIPSRLFLLPVNNCNYYCTTFKQPVQTIDINCPYNIAFSSNGDMFVTSGFTNSIHVYNMNGVKKRQR